jgi:hypothetical protein
MSSPFELLVIMSMQIWGAFEADNIVKPPRVVSYFEERFAEASKRVPSPGRSWDELHDPRQPLFSS